MAAILKWVIRILGGSRTPFVRANPPILSAEEAVEEEKFYYEEIPHRYYPVRLGDTFNDRYEVLLKLGYGTTSTVWLAQDLLRWKRFVALKILTLDASDEGDEPSEPDILQHVSKAVPIDKTHTGRQFISKLLSSFQIDGPGGKHICLVQIPLRENLKTFLNRTPGYKFPLPFFKPLLVQLFYALDYLHTTCNVVHTDISERNLMFETNNGYFEDHLEDEEQNPSPQKELEGRIIYTSRKFIVSKRGTLSRLVISDFGSARILNKEKPIGKGDIQPISYRAPEVIFGADWSYSVDIWNVACLAWYWVEDRSLFIGVDQFNNEGYDPEMLLAEINARIGPPPQELLNRARQNKEFFGQDGKWIGDITIHNDYRLETNEKKLEGEEKELFLHFMKAMLQWMPEDRPTALRLLEHPWLLLNRRKVKGQHRS